MESKKEDTSTNKPGSNQPAAYEVSAEGSLGLLALGAIGIKAWRKKREEAKSSNNQSAKK